MNDAENSPSKDFSLESMESSHTRLLDATRSGVEHAEKVESAQAQHDIETKRVCQAILEHPGLSDTKKAGWILGIAQWESGEDVNLDETVKANATRLAKLDAVLRIPRAPVLAYSGQYNRFDLFSSKGEGLEINFSSHLSPTFTIAVDSAETDGSDSRLIHPHTILNSYVSAADIAQVAANEEFLRLNFVVVGDEAMQAFAVNLFKHEEALAGAAKLNAQQLLYKINLLVIGQGVDLAQEHPAFRAYIESVRSVAKREEGEKLVRQMLTMLAQPGGDISAVEPSLDVHSADVGITRRDAVESARDLFNRDTAPAVRDHLTNLLAQTPETPKPDTE